MLFESLIEKAAWPKFRPLEITGILDDQSSPEQAGTHLPCLSNMQYAAFVAHFAVVVFVAVPACSMKFLPWVDKCIM